MHGASWVLKKKLSHVKRGRRVLLRHQDLIDMIERSVVPAGSEPVRRVMSVEHQDNG